jgi:NAD(P)-dependent dehydrogenase (short-subunit alcohol dehydrogenase family)
VVITARGEKRLEESRDKLLAQGIDAVSVTGDVGTWADAERMVRTGLDRFGRLDILVNNAGVSMRGRFQDLSPEVCRQTLSTNLLGSVYLTRAAMDPILQARGHVVFISSIAGLFGLPGASTYCAGKGALSGLCESLRLELLPQGVHAGVVYLGYTEHDPEKRILSSDGTPVRPDRPAHHTQDFAASLVLRMIEKRRRRLIMTPVGTLGWLIYRISPWLVEKVILRAQAGEWAVFKRFS